MSAPTKVSDERLREVLARWRGNVIASADTLGISENALRKRMKRLGIEGRALAFLRTPTTPNQPPPTMDPQPHGVVVTNPNYHPKKMTHNFPRRADAPTLAAMQTAEAEHVQQAPRPKPGMPRLEPPQVDELRDAKFDYQAKHRVEASESDLLQRFFRECFPEWRKRTCGTEKAKAKA